MCEAVYIFLATPKQSRAIIYAYEYDTHSILKPWGAANSNTYVESQIVSWFEFSVSWSVVQSIYRFLTWVLRDIFVNWAIFLPTSANLEWYVYYRVHRHRPRRLYERWWGP